MKTKISELKRIARGNLPGFYCLCIGTMLLYLLIISLVTMPFVVRQATAPTLANTILYNVALIIISMIATIFQAGIYRIHLAITRKTDASFLDLFWGFRNRPDRFLITGLLLAVINNVFVLPGRIVLSLSANGDAYEMPYIAISVLLLIAGGIATLIVSLMFSQVIYVLLDHPDWNTLAAFRESYHMMKGEKWRLFCTELSFIGWALLGLLSFGLGYLWIIPYIYQTYTIFYLDLLPEYSTYAYKSF